jgi:hypothetical protein
MRVCTGEKVDAKKQKLMDLIVLEENFFEEVDKEELDRTIQ